MAVSADTPRHLAPEGREFVLEIGGEFAHRTSEDVPTKVAWTQHNANLVAHLPARRLGAPRLHANADYSPTPNARDRDWFQKNIVR